MEGAKWDPRDGVVCMAERVREPRHKTNRSDGSKEDTPAFVPTDITVADSLAQYEATAKNTMKRRSFETYHNIA